MAVPAQLGEWCRAGAQHRVGAALGVCPGPGTWNHTHAILSNFKIAFCFNYQVELRTGSINSPKIFYY